QNLSNLAKAWIDSQYQREELQIKQYNAGAGDHEQVIRVEGGLPPLPGCNVTMPVLNGHATNGHDVLAPPAPQIESSAIESSNNAQGPDPPDSVPETQGEGP